jgi:hypothetical protein
LLSRALHTPSPGLLRLQSVRVECRTPRFKVSVHGVTASAVSPAFSVLWLRNHPRNEIRYRPKALAVNRRSFGIVVVVVVVVVVVIGVRRYAHEDGRRLRGSQFDGCFLKPLQELLSSNSQETILLHWMGRMGYMTIW